MKKYYLMAIENGNGSSMFNLGLYYYNVEKNYEEMKKYYLMAVEKGCNDAMYNLGNYYLKKKNYGEMKKYYMMAIKNGNSNAMYNLNIYYEEEEPIENLYIDLVNINNKNEIIDDKINELLNKYEHLKDVYIHPILK
jgi:TPR repeat protein